MTRSRERRGSRALAAALALAVAGAAHADNAADEADVAFELGNRAFAKRDYQAALSSYFLSYRLVPNRNVLFNIARCYESLEQFDQAYRYYNDLAVTGLSAADTKDVHQAMDHLRPKVALLRVVTTPPGADVYVDREDLGSRGRAPQTLAVAPGKHLVRVKLEGYQPAETTLTLTRGREATASLGLTLVVGNVVFAGTPGAQLRETPDGPVVATVPAAVSLPPGKHIFYASAPGFVSAPYLLDVTAQGSARLEVLLAEQPKPSGKLVVVANRENALVRVDGREAGFTPAVITLVEGEHDVEVTAKDTKPYQQRLTLARDQELKVTAELHYAPPPIQAAAKKLLALDEAPASVTVITSEEIHAFGYTTLPQALAAIRGLFVSDDRQYGYLGVRGFSPPGDYNTRVLILWDGHSMNDVWAGQGYLGRELVPDLEEVDHIEIVRGPASALYGTAALFAVINIVPRAHLSGKNVEVTGMVGSLSSAAGHVAAGAGNDPRASFIAASSGYQVGGADTTPIPAQTVLGNDAEFARNAQARVHWGDFSLSGFFNSRGKEIPTGAFGTLLGAPGTAIWDQRGFGELRYEHDFASGANVFGRVYYDESRYHGSWVYAGSDPTLTSLETDAGGADWVGAELRGRFHLFGKNQLTLGVDSQVQIEVYQEAFGGPGKLPLATQARDIIAGYVVDDWQLHPRLSLEAALRVDKYSDLSTVPLSPRVALIGKPYPGGLTKLVVGESFRVPDVYETYYDDNNVTQRPACQPNQPCNLVPETILTGELEHSHDITEELRFTVAGYLNRIQNIVVLSTDPQNVAPQCSGGGAANSVQCLVYENTPSTIYAAGAEAELRWQPGKFAMVDLSYSYVHLHEVIPSSIQGAAFAQAAQNFQDILSGSPVHLASARVMAPLLDPYVRLAVSARYQSARQYSDPTQPSGEALLVGLGLSGETPHLRYFAGIDNLLDERYFLPIPADVNTSPPVPQYGRTFLLRLTGTY